MTGSEKVGGVPTLSGNRTQEESYLKKRKKGVSERQSEEERAPKRG